MRTFENMKKLLLVVVCLIIVVTVSAKTGGDPANWTTINSSLDSISDYNNDNRNRAEAIKLLTSDTAILDLCDAIIYDANRTDPVGHTDGQVQIIRDEEPQE